MTTFNPATVKIGDEMPVLELPPVTRTTLALFAGASGDHNPIHIDIDFARKSGMQDVFAHGMLSMAYLARALSEWVPQKQILSYGVRFVAITNLGDRVRCSGKVVEMLEYRGRRCVRVELTAATAPDKVTLAGDAIIALQ